MNVIITQDYVVGIFARWSDAQHFLALRPAYVRGFNYLNDDVNYPFYLLECSPLPANRLFLMFQNEAAARAHIGGSILYTISEDYAQPDWRDRMGSLSHEHLEPD